MQSLQTYINSPTPSNLTLFLLAVIQSEKDVLWKIERETSFWIDWERKEFFSGEEMTFENVKQINNLLKEILFRLTPFFWRLESKRPVKFNHLIFDGSCLLLHVDDKPTKLLCVTRTDVRRTVEEELVVQQFIDNVKAECVLTKLQKRDHESAKSVAEFCNFKDYASTSTLLTEFYLSIFLETFDTKVASELLGKAKSLTRAFECGGKLDGDLEVFVDVSVFITNNAGSYLLHNDVTLEAYTTPPVLCSISKVTHFKLLVPKNSRRFLIVGPDHCLLDAGTITKENFVWVWRATNKTTKGFLLPVVQNNTLWKFRQAREILSRLNTFVPELIKLDSFDAKLNSEDVYKTLKSRLIHTTEDNSILFNKLLEFEGIVDKALRECLCKLSQEFDQKVINVKEFSPEEFINRYLEEVRKARLRAYSEARWTGIKKVVRELSSFIDKSLSVESAVIKVNANKLF